KTKRRRCGRGRWGRAIRYGIVARLASPYIVRTGCFTTARNSYGSPAAHELTEAEKLPAAVRRWNGVELHSPMRSLASRPLSERYSKATSTDGASPSAARAPVSATPAPLRAARPVSTRGGVSAGLTCSILSTTGLGHW